MSPALSRRPQETISQQLAVRLGITQRWRVQEESACHWKRQASRYTEWLLDKAQVNIDIACNKRENVVLIRF